MKKRNELDKNVGSLLSKIGISIKHKGYDYLKTAIIMTIKDDKVTMNNLYPKIAQQYEVSDSSVERAMRYAIKMAWEYGEIKRFNECNMYSKPTNTVFIKSIANHIEQLT